MDYLISIIIGIFVGIFPNHFLFEKLFPHGNNEKNRMQSITLILLDIIKGLLIVLLTKYFMNFDFLNIILALIIGTLFHSFFQEFKFQKREGHTVALTGLALIIPSIILIWFIIWLISFAYKKNNNFSLPSATFLTGLLAVTSANIFNNKYWLTDPLASSEKEFIILVGLLFIVIISSQIDRIKSYFLKVK